MFSAYTLFGAGDRISGEIGRTERLIELPTPSEKLPHGSFLSPRGLTNRNGIAIC